MGRRGPHGPSQPSKTDSHRQGGRLHRQSNVSERIYPRKAGYESWVDASVRIAGSAIDTLQQIFLADWQFNFDHTPDEQQLFPVERAGFKAASVVQVLPTGPTSMASRLVDVMLQAVRLASGNVIMTTPYFVPDEAILAAMRSAALGDWR